MDMDTSNDQEIIKTPASQDTEGKLTNLDKFVDLISKEPNMRPDFSCQEFIPFLRKHIEWFSSLKPDLVRDIIKRCKFTRVPAETVFIKQGDIGDSMYAILKGTVGVHVIFDSENERECLSKVEAAMSKKKFNKNDLGNEVAQKVEGSCIGEVALVKDNCMRTASCVSVTECDVLVIDRSLYSVSVKEFIEKEFQDKTQFVERNPLFKSWTGRQKNQLIISMKKTRIGFGEKLVRQGHDVDGIYFIYKGDVEVHIDVKLYHKQYPQLYADLKTLLPELIKGTQRDTLPPHLLRKERMKGNKSQRVCILGANETIGSLELILGLDTYIETIISHGECQLLTLKRSQFERTFKKKFAETTLHMLKEALASKLCLYMYQCDPQNVAFLKFFNIKLIDAHVLQQVRRSKYGKVKGSSVGAEKVTKANEGQEVINVLKRLHMNADNAREFPAKDKSEIALAKMDRRLRNWSETTNMNGSKLTSLQSSTITVNYDKHTA
uniref:Cyclic nucleotide-binding domain-containing protein n=1 Tax=Arion vulgaris TaxID=1028688 RepID=A0A0B7A4N8_9EUPU